VQQPNVERDEPNGEDSGERNGEYDYQPQLQRLVQFYETLSVTSLTEVIDVYDPQARFKDPFNEVVGHAAITRIFEHMFVQLDAPRFVVSSHIAQGAEAFLTWDFTFRMKRWNDAPQCIRGATHVHFGVDGRVLVHRDYWDAAEELYEKLPLLGAFMRMLKRAANR
jgi:steroid delta-isomerase